MQRSAPSPVFVSAATAAALCEVSEDTWRAWVERGVVPLAAVRTGQIVRWHWPTVEAALVGPPKCALDGDVALERVRHAKGQARAGA